MEHEIRGDTDLETIFNDYVCKKCGVRKPFVADFFSKNTHWQSDRDHRVTSIRSLLRILRNLTPLQLLHNALT